jgi:two-component sensor histidine kinase
MRVHSLARTLLLVVILALIPAVVILVWTVFLLREVRTSEVHAQAQKTAELTYLEMERVFAGVEGVLRVIATAPVVQSGNAAACSFFISRTVEALPYLASISIADADGEVWCLPVEAAEAVSIADRQYFKEAVSSSSMVIGLYTVDRATERKVLPIALRLEDHSGNTVGVVSAYPDLAWFQSLLEQRSPEPGNSITMADRDGTILARTPLPERFVGTVIPADFQRLVQATDPGTEELISQDGTRRIIGYIPPAAGAADIYVSAGVAYDPAFALVRSIATSGLLIWVVGAAVAVLLALHTTRVSIVRPFNQLVATVEAWRKNDSSARSGMQETDGEIGRVGVALDRFMDELVAARTERQRAEEQRRFLAQELHHRVKNLLTLVQIVARQTFANLNVPEAVQTFASRLRAIADANDLLLKEHSHAAPVRPIVENSIGPFRGGPPGRFKIEGPDLLLSSAWTVALQMALHELCTNASKYGALSTNDGRVAITWSAADMVFSLIWEESGGPSVEPPSRVGFGSKVIQQALEQSLAGKVQLSFPPTGLVCRITAPLGQGQV